MNQGAEPFTRLCSFISIYDELCNEIEEMYSLLKKLLSGQEKDHDLLQKILLVKKQIQEIKALDINEESLARTKELKKFLQSLVDRKHAPSGSSKTSMNYLLPSGKTSMRNFSMPTNPLDQGKGTDA